MSYPVTFEADYVEQRNRLTTFFRLILAIPVAIVLYVFGIVASIAIVIAWFAIVITGRYPRGPVQLRRRLQPLPRARDRLRRCCCTDPYPPFSGADDPCLSGAHAVRRAARRSYSRLKTLLPLHPRDPDHGRCAT